MHSCTTSGKKTGSPTAVGQAESLPGPAPNETDESGHRKIFCSAFHWILLLIRFVAELSMLAALGLWGVKTGKSVVMKAVLAVGAPTLAALLWGLFVAPRRRIQHPFGLNIVVECLVFGAAGLALLKIGRLDVGISLFMVAAADRLALKLIEG
jgi:hypothetical protein